MGMSATRCKGKLQTLMWLILAFLVQPLPAAGTSTLGEWSPVKPWPLIAVHAVLMPDGRVMTYGTKSDGTQTGFFIYDVWDPYGRPGRRAPDAAEHDWHGHILQLAIGVARGRWGVHCRRGHLDRHATHQYRQQQQQRLRLQRQYADPPATT